MKRVLFLFMVCVIPLFSVGSVCKTEPKSKEEAIKVFDLTGKVIDFLESNNAELAFVARKNKENHGISYTHLGMAWKDDKGKWVVTNLLQNCENSDELGTYDDGMALFFAPVSIYDSLVLIPSMETQTELKEAIKNKEKLPDTKIYVWTGYYYDDLIKQTTNGKLQEILKKADVLIDGPYI